MSWESPSCNLFLVSLALADLALYPYPLILLAIFHDGWALGEARCKASAFVMGLSVIGSVFDITAIAINRYCCVCHSVTYHRIYCHWFLTTFMVFVIFVICWAPLNCIGLAVAIDSEVAPRVPEGLFVTSYFVAYFNSCLNAIVYGILNQNFCREYKKIASALWNPWHYLQDSSKGSRVEGPESQAPPVVNIQPAVQADALLHDPRPGDKLMK
ncbi:hypothetical protein J1605_001540 [Eschrichtius robustus]|uniref:G-protein coupled receptors family 1 profile domain-containing protein n=1 Tax=Eschrichtius robustus TaxID=9764 RepID=A0AB34I4I2_ESCRO|nr:hypothetical protein J1605_001540 [Eschrichtius robustus]MBV96055.1 Melatonin receptor type 1B [Eschrichtius robustus]